MKRWYRYRYRQVGRQAQQSNETNETINEEIINLTQIFRKDLQTPNYLFKNCKTETLGDLSNVINNGLLNYEY